MTSTATTTSGKRKLVYKQDPDGVFRLKKVETNATSAASSILSADEVAPASVDELCDLSYKVRPVAAPSGPVALAPVPAPARDVLPAPKQTKLRLKKKQFKSKSKPTDNLLDLIADSESILNSLKRPDPVKEEKPAPVLLEVPPTTSSVPKPKFWHYSNFAPKFSFNFDFPTSIMDPRIACYIAGVATAVFVQKMAPTLGYYALILLNLLKVAVIAGLVVGSVCWYTGIIKISNQSIVSFLDGLKSKITGEEPAPVASRSPVGGLVSSYDDEDDDDVDSDVSWPGMESEDEEPAPVVPVPAVVAVEPRPRVRARSESPTKGSRRSTLTNITPFVAPTRRHTNPIISPAAGYLRTKELEKRQQENQGRRESNASSIESRGSDPRRYHGDLHSPVHKLHKKLPAFPNEDLPLVNEIKVLRGQDGDDDSLSDLVSPTAINRHSSVLSKASVLGTRANYDKFLANVNEDI